MKISLVSLEKQGLESIMVATSRKEVDQRTSQLKYTGVPIRETLVAVMRFGPS
jgi:hypothetical protein